MNRPAEVSIVVPIFNEQQVLEQTLAELLKELEATDRRFELLCVDDGSDDDTPELLARAASNDERIRQLTLSRNFGKEAALAAGLVAARGQAVILIDADLQHPPALIPQMLQLWDEGHDVVNGIKKQRARESWTYRLMVRLFHALMGRAAGRRLAEISDFKLLDRQVVDAIVALPERNRFFRGLVAWVGFKVTDLPFEVAERLHGRTKWTARALVRYGFQNLVAFSSFPLRVVAATGLIAVILAIVLAGQTLYRYFAGTAAEGFPTVILLEIFLGGLILGSVGVLAVYLSAMFDELKARPVFIVRRPRDRQRVAEHAEPEPSNRKRANPEP